MKTREEIYDELIFPLMDRIIDICVKNNIPALATFELDVDDPNEPENPLNCTTVQCVKYANGNFFKDISTVVLRRVAASE